MSAYILYMTSIRGDIMKENPAIKFTEVGKIAGARWKALSPVEQEGWKVKAAAVRAENPNYGKRSAQADTEAPKKKAKKNPKAAVCEAAPKKVKKQPSDKPKSKPASEKPKKVKAPKKPAEAAEPTPAPIEAQA